MTPTETSAPPTDRSIEPRFVLWLLVITLAGGGWRAFHLAAPAFDHDEVYEIVHRTTDLGELAFRHDGFPPLYRWLVSAAIDATGWDLAARWFSVLVGTATIPLVGFLGRRLAGSAAGLAAAAGLALSANHVLLSQHARGYGLMVFFATWMLLAAWRLRDSDRWRDWASFLVASWLAIATHYFAGLLLLILGPLLLIEKRGPALRRGLAAAAILAVAGLPLVACLRADMADSGEFFSRVGFDKEAYAFSYLWLVTGNTLGPSVSELRDWVADDRTRDALMAMAPWAVAAAACIGPLAVAGWRRFAPRDRRWLLVLMLAPPLMASLAAPLAPTGYNYRYIVWMIVPLVVWIGAGATATRPRGLPAIAAVGLIGMSVFATTNRHFDPRYYENDYHAVVALIESTDKTGQPPAVLAAPRYYGEGVLYTLPETWLTRNVTAHPANDQDWDTALPAFAERIGSRDEAWLVTQWFPPGHRQRELCDRLAARLGAEFIERVSSTVMVYRFPIERLR